MEYAAEIRAVGGRNGRVWNEAGTLSLSVIPPGSNRSGVTPEELLGAAWGACFGGAFAFEAKELSGVSGSPEMRVEVVLEALDGEYEIILASLEVVPNEGDVIDEVVLAAQRAHERCPVSKVFGQGVSQVGVHVQSR